MSEKLNLLSFKGNMRILHLSWIAFFISFAVWFNHAPLMSTLRQNFGLTDQEVGILLILNVALTIPARILVGMLVDRFGPRRMFTLILVSAGLVCFSFAFAQNFTQLAVTRFLLGFVGAGFVVGIRMIGEWFPARQTGIAQGIYGGWGNFGSAASAMLLPALALCYWRRKWLAIRHCGHRRGGHRLWSVLLPIGGRHPQGLDLLQAQEDGRHGSDQSGRSVALSADEPAHLWRIWVCSSGNCHRWVSTGSACR